MKTHQLTRTPQGQDILSAWREGVAEAARGSGSGRRLLSRERELLPLFWEQYEKLKAMPRRMRRLIQKKWKHTLAGVAVLMVLGGGSAAQAGTTINVPAGDVDALIEAINDANSETGDFVGADTIVLANSTFTPG